MKFVSLLKTTLCLWLAPIFLFGYSYESFERRYFTTVHVLTVDPRQHLIVPVRALGEIVKRETVRSLAVRHGAIAAINGGFWKKDGTPAGILKINFRWYGTPVKPRGAIGWSGDGQKVLIDQVLTNHSLQDVPNGETIEVIPASIPPLTSLEDWKNLEHIVGGVPLLVQEGAIVEDYSPEMALESFVMNKYSRTAVGIKENGDWVLVVVDGRLWGLLGGMQIRELASLMLDLGCVYALNLDGGSSSTMYLEGSVMNDSYGLVWENGRFVQAVSDAILIFDR